MKLKNTLLITASLLSFKAFSQQLSIKDAIAEGLAQSPEVAVSASKAKEAHWHKMENYQNFLPSLTANGNDITQQNYLYTPVVFPGATSATSFPAIVPNYTFNFTATLPLFDGFVSSRNFDSAANFEQAAQDDDNWTRFKLERNIALNYFRALGSKILKEVAQQNLATLEDHLRDVELFKKAGVSTNYDVLRVEVQVSEAHSEVLNAADNTEVARNKLSETLGRFGDDRALVGELPVLEPSLIKDLPTSFLETRKDIVSQKEKIQGLELTASAKRQYWLPSINAFATYEYYNNRDFGFLDSQFRDAYMVGFNFNWTLFDGLGSSSRAKVIAEQKVQAEKGLQASRLHAAGEFDFWRRKYVYYCQVYKSRVEDVKKSAETVRLARAGRRVGARTNTDLLDAESELYRARAGAVTAQIGAIEALINLELTTGMQLLKL